MADTIKFPDSAEARERRREKAALQAKKSETSSAHYGRRAWDRIEKWRREELKLLELNDRIAIAQNLWWELDRYPGKLADLYKGDDKNADLPHNIKEKVTLAPGEASKGKRLKAEVTPYLKLTEALARKTGEDLYLLADRVLFGTWFHPVSGAELEEARLIMKALQVAVDRVDLEFNLWEQCQAVADIRKPLEEPYYQALLIKDQVALSAFFDANPFHVVGNPIKLWWPIDGGQLLDSETDCVPVNPFWVKPYPAHGATAAGAWSGAEIFFFPHIYLGPAIQWDGWIEYRDGYPLPTMSPTAKESTLASIQASPEPHVLFNEETHSYQLYADGPEPDEKGKNGIEVDCWGLGEHMENAARWLVIYPDPDAKRLVPAIYMQADYSITELMPLTDRLIAEFGDTDRWQYFGCDGAPTLLQRLKDLTGFVTGDFKVMDAWRETAERFHWNPIFRSRDPGEIKNIIYRRHLEKWIAEGPSSIDGSEDKE